MSRRGHGLATAEDVAEAHDASRGALLAAVPGAGAPEGAATGSGAGGEVGQLLIKPQTAPYTFWEKMF